jgi:hypothetical protein
MSQELTQQLLEQWEAAAAQAANQPDQSSEVAESFGEFVKSHLSPGSN